MQGEFFQEPKLFEGLEKTVLRTGCEAFSFVWIPSHLHVFVRTSQPNRSRWMQYDPVADDRRFVKSGTEGPPAKLRFRPRRRGKGL